MKRRKLFLWIVGLVLLSGCSHQLEVKNLHHYQANSLVSLPKHLSIGVITPNEPQNGQTLVTGTANALTKYAGNVVYPYLPNSLQPVDVVTKISVSPNHRGSGWNFLINWPGFLIFTPAWHGYVYHPTYDVGVELISASNQQLIDSFTIPIELDVRHAEMDRTWTEISWFEVSIIALVGGIVFTQYDDDVTPPLEREVKGTIGDYIAQEIVKRVASSTNFKAISKEGI